MEDQEKERTMEAEQKGLKEEELELSLGLRPAKIRRHFQSSNPKTPIQEDLSLMSVPICGKGGGSEQDSEGLGLEFEAKREAQALRRQEARKKREEKRKSPLPERRRKGGPNRNTIDAEETVTPPNTTSFMANANPLNGMSYYMMMPGLVGTDPKTINPSAAGFRPYQLPTNNGKQSVSGSSAASDYRSTSNQGGSSSDGGSNSSHSQPPEPTTSKPQTVIDSQSSFPCQGNNPECTTPSNPTESLKPEVKTEAGKNPSPNPTKPPKPPVQQTNEAMLLSQMPYVSTTGNGPNGKTLTGFLYKYTNSEVCIVCVCHGTSFTPAGFVDHAGGVDVQNPLRHITVVPFAIT